MGSYTWDGSVCWMFATAGKGSVGRLYRITTYLPLSIKGLSGACATCYVCFCNDPPGAPPPPVLMFLPTCNSGIGVGRNIIFRVTSGYVPDTNETLNAK